MKAKWSDVPGDAQEALLDWYNVRDVTAKDRATLAKLYDDGLFSFYNCAECESPVRLGNPDDWGHFQGVSQCEGIGELCGDCYAILLRLADYAGISI